MKRCAMHGTEANCPPFVTTCPGVILDDPADASARQDAERRAAERPQLVEDKGIACDDIERAQLADLAREFGDVDGDLVDGDLDNDGDVEVLP